MISVIIPTLNREKLLKKTLGSVFSQTFQDFEIILIDDGSSDDTKEIIPNYKDDRIKYFYQENKGPAAARNSGVKKAKGDFIAFLDSDDWWDKKKLEIQFESMKKNPEYAISHTEEIWYRNGKILNQKKKHKKYHGHIFDKCLSLCVVSMSTVMIKKEVFEKTGLFDESMPCCEDYDFWLRASIDNRFLLTEESLTLKDGGREDQLSYIYRTGMDKFRIKSLENLIKSEQLKEEQRYLVIKELNKKRLIYGKGCMKHGKKEEGEYHLSRIQQ